MTTETVIHMSMQLDNYIVSHAPLLLNVMHQLYHMWLLVCERCCDHCREKEEMMYKFMRSLSSMIQYLVHCMLLDKP
eukprot:5550-Heterococcus_DN1.PRE.7